MMPAKFLRLSALVLLLSWPASAPVWANTPRALLSAASSEDLAGVTRTLASGVDVNAVDADGWTALMFAAAAGNLQIVEALLKAKADPNILAKDEKSPLFAAVFSGNAAVVRALLAAGARTDVGTASGNNPLTLARDRKRADLVALLAAKPETVAASSAGGNLKAAVAQAARPAGSADAAAPVTPQAPVASATGVPDELIRSYLTEKQQLDQRRAGIAAQQARLDAQRRAADEEAAAEAQRRREAQLAAARAEYEQCKDGLTSCKNRCSTQQMLGMLGSMNSNGVMSQMAQRQVGMAGLECLTSCEQNYSCREP